MQWVEHRDCTITAANTWMSTVTGDRLLKKCVLSSFELKDKQVEG